MYIAEIVDGNLWQLAMLGRTRYKMEKLPLQFGKLILPRSNRTSLLTRSSGPTLSHDSDRRPRSCSRDNRRNYRCNQGQGAWFQSNYDHFCLGSTSNQMRPSGAHFQLLRFQSSGSKQINETSPDNNEDTQYATNGNKNHAIHICGTIPSHGKDIQIGQCAEIHRVYTQNDINTFGTLIGDLNPVHFPSKTYNNESATQPIATSEYDKPLVHGMQYSSLFSTIFGTLVPGAIYRSQSLRFQQPVYVEDQVCGKVVVKKLRQINKRGQNGSSGVLCTCDTTVTKSANLQRGDITGDVDESNGGEVILCLSGEAQVWLPGATVLL